MKFGEAVDLLNDGYKITRSGWNGKRMFLYLIKGSELAKGLKYGYGEYRGEPVFDNFIVMKTANNKIVPWLASQTDMLAEDWGDHQMKFGQALELPDHGHNITQSGSHKYMYVVGRTVIDAKNNGVTYGRVIRSTKNPIFISRNASSLDGLSPDRMVLVLLTGYLENPIVKNDFFRYLVENAAEVNYE